MSFVVHRPRVPGVRHYRVVAPASVHADTTLAELLAAAESIARREAAAYFGDPECFSLLCNASRTRRRNWPHVHIILAPDVGAKRRALWWLCVKHLTRPLLRVLRVGGG